MMDWEQTLLEAAEKGLITFGLTPKSGDIFLQELRLRRMKRNVLITLYTYPEHIIGDAISILDFIKANSN